MQTRKQNRLMQLITDNLNAPRKPVRADVSGDEANIYLYDAIDSYWGISAEAFAKELSAITAPTINLRINSPGGDVFDARAIATAITNHSSTIIAHIDGLAASAATYVALAANEVRMADGGFFMIHQAWTLAWGNSAELRDMATLLDKVDASIVNDYAKKTGKSVDQIKEWMAAETWFSAQEALDNGFVDQVATSEAAENRWNLAAYANAPKALLAPRAENLYSQHRDRAARYLEMLNRTAP